MQFKYVQDKGSEVISYKLWTDVTFVNFKERAYVSYAVDSMQMLDELESRGFVAVDTAIADTVMRMNSLAGCKTMCTCSGHPGEYCYGYIWFEKVPESIAKQLDDSPYWNRDTSPKARNTWRLENIGKTVSVTWLKAMLSLAEMEGLPERHVFVPHVFVRDEDDKSDQVWISLMPEEEA